MKLAKTKWWKRLFGGGKTVGEAEVVDAGDKPEEKPTPRERPYRQAEQLRIKLCELGFHERAYSELEAMHAEGRSPKHCSAAAWQLALWHANRDDAEDARLALSWLDEVMANEKSQERLQAATVIAAECEAMLGGEAQARERIDRALAKAPGDPNLMLAAANLVAGGGLAARLEWINKVLVGAGLAPLEVREGEAEPYDRLDVTEAREVFGEFDGTPPTVTVIVPAYNAARTIGTALAAVSAQTWKWLEVIVVDDCSSDDTAVVVAAHAQRDPRIRLVNATENAGPYVARNLALNEATGEFITCHDADDWSHPEKIERQMRHLLAHPEVVANTSQQARAFGDLRLHRRGNPGFYLIPNFSSLLFRAEPVRDKLGYWDSVRFGADSEMIRRLVKVFGVEGVVHLETGPVSFQRQTSGSLTGCGVFGFPGYPMGARKEYLDASSGYHQRAGDLRYDFPQRQRPFAVPWPMLPLVGGDSGRRQQLDLVIAADFRRVDGPSGAAMELIAGRAKAGEATGLVHMCDYEGDPHGLVADGFRELMDSGTVRMLVYGEKVACHELRIFDPAVFAEKRANLVDLVAAEVRCPLRVNPMDGEDQARSTQCVENIVAFCSCKPTFDLPTQAK